MSLKEEDNKTISTSFFSGSSSRGQKEETIPNETISRLPPIETKQSERHSPVRLISLVSLEATHSLERAFPSEIIVVPGMVEYVAKLRVLNHHYHNPKSHCISPQIRACQKSRTVPNHGQGRQQYSRCCRSSHPGWLLPAPQEAGGKARNDSMKQRIRTTQCK